LVLEKHQDKKCSHKSNLEPRSRCHGKAIGITYSECVSVEPCLPTMHSAYAALSSVASHRWQGVRKGSVVQPTFYSVWVRIFPQGVKRRRHGVYLLRPSNVEVKMSGYTLLYSYVTVRRFCVVCYFIIICFSLLFSNYLTYAF